MSACETRWRDAHAAAVSNGTAQDVEYIRLLKERCEPSVPFHHTHAMPQRQTNDLAPEERTAKLEEIRRGVGALFILGTTMDSAFLPVSDDMQFLLGEIDRLTKENEHLRSDALRPGYENGWADGHKLSCTTPSSPEQPHE